MSSFLGGLISAVSQSVIKPAVPEWVREKEDFFRIFGRKLDGDMRIVVVGLSRVQRLRAPTRKIFSPPVFELSLEHAEHLAIDPRRNRILNVLARRQHEHVLNHRLDLVNRLAAIVVIHRRQNIDPVAGADQMPTPE